ncbi:MAG TPA: universal stress protein [Terriglobales bacterium]|nr:universal stress protein [Terriglobales bacterium]
MKLLLAIDYSRPSQRVVDEVARRPWPATTTACILHIIDWPQLPSSGVLIQAERQSAVVLVESASEKLCNAGIPTITKVLEGQSRIMVAEYAKEWGADLLLVGSHGAGRVARFLLGSTAQAALRRAPCSVEIVRESAEEAAAKRILLATDGSECSMAAARSVAKRPWPADSQIRVISVVPLIVPVGENIPMAPVYYPFPEITEALQREARGQAEAAVARARQVLTEAGIKPAEIDSFPLGDPKQVILDQAKQWCAGLIVVGSHGYRGIDRLMLGSVSEAVAMHAHCSVEVIRESSLTPDKKLS